MSELVVRRLLVDLETPFERHWNGGDAFRTAFFNALSFSFPAGEQFFIDSVRMGVEKLAPGQRERFDREVPAFIGQEATHRRIHQRFNAQLERQGLVNRWQARIERRRKRLEGKDVRAWVGVTAATEHLTAILAEHLFAHPQALEGAEPRLADLWYWHSSEESEHRATAFDLYRALDGNEYWRRRLFVIVSLNFGIDVLRQTALNLRRDGSLWRWSTWRSGWRFLFADGGLVRCLRAPWKRYLDADFHPSQGDASAGERWLADHAALAPPVASRV